MMTADKIETLAANKNVDAIVNEFAALKEKQRKELVPIIDDLLVANQKLMTTDREEWRHRFEMYELMSAAVGSQREVQRSQHFTREATQRAFAQILIDRKPKWLHKLVEHGVHFETLVVLIDSGHITDLASDGAVRSILICPIDRVHEVIDKIIVRQDLLQTLYRIFEVETRMFSYVDEADLKGYGWPRAIAELCDQGHLDRERLLGRLIDSFALDFNKTSLKGLMCYHDHLASDDANRKSLEERYLTLLGSPQTSLVGFALKHLKLLYKSKQLDVDSYVRELPRVMQCSAKGHPKAALSLLKSIVNKTPNLRSAATLSVAEGLANTNAEVQEACVALIEEWADSGDYPLAEALTSYRDHVAASVRPRIEVLLNKLGSFGAETESTPADADKPKDWKAELKEQHARIENLPKTIRKKLALDEIANSIESGTLQVPALWKFYDAPLLTNLEPIAPIETVDELFDAVAKALETVDDADEVERILDGISRLCDQRPDDFDRRAAPIVKRMKKILDGFNPSNALLAEHANRGIARVLAAWLIGKPFEIDVSPSPGADETWHRVPVRRCRLLYQRVVERCAAPLLAAPTHRGGWIDPRIWVERLIELSDRNLEFPLIDLIQSLLRLTPDEREAGRERLQNYTIEFRNPILYALGAEAAINIDSVPGELWIAAARCRDPEVDLSNDQIGTCDFEGPDLIMPGNYKWRSSVGKRRPWGSMTSLVVDAQDGCHPNVCFTVDPPMPTSREVIPDLPGIELTELGWQLQNGITDFGEQYDIDAKLVTLTSHAMMPGFDPKWLLNWSSMLWPQKLDGYWHCAALAFLCRIEQKSSAFEPHSAYLDPLFETDRPLSELAALALWIATLSKDADSKTAAIDAWAEIIADGRGDTNILGSVIVKLSLGGWVRLNRVSDSLGQVARVSPLHALTVSDVLQQLLASFDELPRDAHHILQLLRELLVELGQGVSEETHDKLSSKKGSSKNAKLGREIAGLVVAPTAIHQEALTQFLDARIDRGERWAVATK